MLFQSRRKRLKRETSQTNYKPNRNQGIVVDAVSVATTSNDQQENLPETPPPYLTLIDDCWEHIFDYLQILDVLTMGKTCKRLEQIAGHYMCEYYPKLRFYLEEGKVKLIQPYKFRPEPSFYQYIGELHFPGSSELDFHLDDEMFSSLKTLSFFLFRFDEIQFEYMRSVLKNVENIHIDSYCNLSTETFKQLAVYCPKLKYLHISGCSFKKKVLRSLFSQHFPSLEHLHYRSEYFNFDMRMNLNAQIHELKPFLEKHTKLKHFECRAPFLWANRDLLCETRVQLNTFTIDLSSWKDRLPLNRFIDLIKELHATDFYKALHLSFHHNDKFDNAICTLPAIEKLDMKEFSVVDFSHLSSIKELNIGLGRAFDLDLELVSKNLINLEKLIFSYGYIYMMKFCHLFEIPKN